MAPAYQIERLRVDFTAPNRRIAFAIDQCEQRPHKIGEGRDSLDKRFESMQLSTNNLFEAIRQIIEKRFDSAREQMHGRFDALVRTL